jgi:ATP-binding cassette subfamily B protein
VSSRPVAALWRLRPYLRPYRFQLIAMIAAAVCAEGAEIAIPLLTKAVIDGAIAHHERALLIPIGMAAIGLGAGAAVLNLIRRWVPVSPADGYEREVEELMPDDPEGALEAIFQAAERLPHYWVTLSSRR